MAPSQTLAYRLTFALVVVVHLSGLLTDITTGDSALYAIVSKEMAFRNDYVQLFRNGADWLDKPHFQFWVSALSFEVFGVSAWAFKLPALLFTAMAAAYTWLLARRLYGRTVADLAVLVLLTALHLILSNTDVRAEPYLTGLIVGSTYHFVLADQDERVVRNVFLGSALAAAALMTKGLFTLIPIAGAVGGAALLGGRAKSLLRPRWFAAAGLTAVLTLPELIALYLQFDLHPDKVVFDRTGVSGVRWFLWDSQFGRFFNTGPIQGSGDPTFFLHTLLWAFFPWGLLLYAALAGAVVGAVRRRASQPEFYLLSGALVTLVVFSASRFQLPHYTNVLFPFLAVLTAGWLAGAQSPGQRRFEAVSQSVMIVLGVAIVVAFQVLFRPPGSPFGFLLVAVPAVAVALALPRLSVDTGMAWFYRSCLVAVLLNGYVQLVAYPSLLHFQSGTRVAAVANALAPGAAVLQLGVNSYPLVFHLEGPAPEAGFEAVSRAADETGAPVLVYTDPSAVPQLEAQGLAVEVLETLDHFHITRLSRRFIDHSQRASQVEARVLLRVEAADAS